MVHRNPPPPPPRRPGTTKRPIRLSSIDRVRGMSRALEDRDRPFDPERRTPRDTKSHHFMVNRGEADQQAAQELSLYIENTAELFGPGSRADAIRLNLLRKIKKGIFDRELSEKAWMYLMEDGAKAYAKEFSVGSDWSQIFSRPTRQLAASYFAKSFEDEARLGNYDHLLKKSMRRNSAMRRNSEVDFDDEDAVLAEMAAELDFPVDELSIETARNYESFGVSPVYMITTEGGSRKRAFEALTGRRDFKEWYVVLNDDAAHELALALVKQDLEHEPEIFNQDFLQNHIDLDRLRRDLHSDTHSSNYDRLSEERTNDFWREADRYGMDVPEEDEDGDLPDPDDSQIDELAGLITDEQLKDPIEYLSDIYGDQEGLKQAMNIAGIDVEAAAEEAVSADGEGHFLSPYDGQTNETNSGFVYWRHN